MPRTAVWIIAGALAIAAVASLWLAGEMHYRNCLARGDQQARADSAWRVFGVDPGEGCSRWPF
jgi:hypothetical protein